MQNINQNREYWAALKGSFTAAVDKVSRGELRFSLLRAAPQILSWSEAKDLNCPLLSKAWVREVAWFYQEKLQVIAKAVIPKDGSEAYRTLANWGDKPLGHLLYADSSMQEAPVRILSPDPGYALQRRRIIRFQGHDVLISEQMTEAFLSTWQVIHD